MSENIRFQQRFSNFEKAFLFLHDVLKQDSFSPLEEAGVIHSFKFSFELSWKMLKDYLEAQGCSVTFSRDVITEAFSTKLIEDGHTWIDMLERRNFLSHTYDRT